MLPQTIAGYTLEQALSSNDPQIERWRAIGVTGSAEIFIIPHAHSGRYKMLPKWGPFSDFSIHELSTKSAIVVPGMIAADLRSIRRRLGDGPTVGFAWHIAGALADLHDKGESHGLLHADNVGLDDNGQLCIRPALAAAITEEPDRQASAQATDCWQLGFLLDALGISEKLDSHFSLLMAGLRREKAIIRMQSGRAVRQALSAVTARNVQWEDELKKQLGDEWGLDRLPATEERILPRLYPRRPTATRVSIPERTEEYKSLSPPSTQKESRPTASRRKTSRRAQDSSLGVSLPNVPLNKLKAPSKGIRLPSPNVSDENLEEEFEDAATEAKVATVAQIRVSSPSRKAMISANPDQPFVQLIPETRSFTTEPIESADDHDSAASNQVSEENTEKVATIEVRVDPPQQLEDETQVVEPDSSLREIEPANQPPQEVEAGVEKIGEAAEIPKQEAATLVLPNRLLDKESSHDSQSIVESDPPTEEVVLAEQEDEDSFFDLDVLENALAEVEGVETPTDNRPELPEIGEKQQVETIDDTELAGEDNDDDSHPLESETKPVTARLTIEKSEQGNASPDMPVEPIEELLDPDLDEEHQEIKMQEADVSVFAEDEVESIRKDVQAAEKMEETVLENEETSLTSTEETSLQLDEEQIESEESEEVTEETPEVTVVIASVGAEASTQHLTPVISDPSQENTETTIQSVSQSKPSEEEEIIFAGLDDEQWEALEAESANSIGAHAEEQYPVQDNDGKQHHSHHETAEIELEKPKWEGVTGVTSDPSREAELGAGKWTEASERPVAHFVEAMSQEPTREFENPSEKQNNVPLQRDVPVATSKESLKWEGVTGVTSDPSREAELGAGKWTEASERSATHFVEAMSDAPTRDFAHPLEKQSTQLAAPNEVSTSADQPKWGGVTGVTADPSREAELGAGKWTEASERSAAHFAEAMSDAPTRELEDLSTDDRSWRWRLIVILCGVVVAAVAFYAFLELLGT